MNFTATEQNNTIIVSLQGRLDSTTSEAFENHIMGKIDAGRNKLIIDFADLDYISSAGLRVLLLVAKRLKAADKGGFALCHLRKHVWDVLGVSGFLQV